LVATTLQYKPGAEHQVYRLDQARQLLWLQTSSAPSLSTCERQELLELRKKLKRVEMKRDILAKAMTWLANNKD
jgi:transposase